MGKWLGLAAALLIALLVVMWRSLSTSEATPPAHADEAQVPDEASKLVNRTILAKPKPEDKPADDKPKKLDPMSDEFFYKFTEQVPKQLTSDAAQCYEGRSGSLHRNQKLVLTFNVTVKNGDVTVHDVKIKPPDPDEEGESNNTLHDPALESCFIQKVARSGWHDDSLPDYEWPDELVLRPERGMKKYMKWNREYVGAPAPKTIQHPIQD